jgi:hypothetical protein
MMAGKLVCKSNCLEAVSMLRRDLPLFWQYREAFNQVIYTCFRKQEIKFYLTTLFILLRYCSDLFSYDTVAAGF